VSKLFTWTAVMQLVEQGKLDLDADVNTYLGDLKLPATHDKPITLRNLMTHTAGLEDGGLGYLFAESAEHLVPIRDWLAAHMPERVRPPTTDFTSGTNAAYSNWGTALAGYIVEVVSGMPFDDYVERHIFEPLGMSRSTFREPLPPQLAERMSGGYVFENGRFERRGFEFIHSAAPAGSLSSTATDMARFMLAHLQGGELDGARILAPETAALMHARTMSPDPALNGSALGFYETRMNGYRVIGHGGDTAYFHSVLALIPEARVGLFASVNTGGDGAITAIELERAFIKHFFPAHLPKVEPRADANERNVRYAGTYRMLRRSYTKIDKVFAAFSDMTVVPMPDGTLLAPDFLARKPARWVEVGDGVFRKIDEDVFIAFKGDDGGRATHMVGPFSPIAAERIGWYESTTLHLLVAVIATVLFVSMVVSAIRQYRADRSMSGLLRWARPALAAAGVLLVASVIGLVVGGTTGLDDLLTRVPTSFYVALTLPLLALPLTLLAVYCTVSLWRSRTWRTGARVHYTLTTLAAIAFLLVLHYWNLLGYRFG